MGYSIRRFRPGDEANVYEVCLRTGAAGADATLDYDDPALLGHVYAGPYLALAPEFAFVLVDGSDAVVGYALGTPDTVEFARACERAWWPPLRERYPDQPRRASDAELVRAIHRPSLTPAARPDQVLAEYPAHLHIDVLPPAQGAGHGRALMERLLDALRAAGARGVHLGVAAVNARAIGFYERLGFTTLSEREGGRLMAKRLTVGPGDRG
jgi:ribosomal protein S18 acetylase RimI-like enzyme